MRAILLSLLASFAAPAWCEDDILAVLQRSQQMQLDALTEAQVDDADPAVQVVRRSFQRVLDAADVPGDVRLLVVRGPLLAVCLMGRVVAANVSLADMSESERSFVLAHELGHVRHRHWAQLGQLYKRHIPGEVVQAHTDAIAGVLGREASQLSHEHEYEADAFAMRLIRHLGEPEDTPLVLFQHLPMIKATATHPGTQQRVVHLRTLQ
ncbi:M48 family metalloprotease [Methylibium petroleiphilum]|uniref:M48 family metalloprotease n=1 Tax=Methylibium petroleiphilum TaxID=105560 RepID=UPI001ACA4AFB|nr:M48 family metalloprotease [Methylibium petroleiphilum]MBN9204276.1 M48 family metalloprotease [Methylibium petroleiphilum]